MQIKKHQLFNFTILILVFIILSSVDWEGVRSIYYADRASYIRRLENIWLHGLEFRSDTKSVFSTLFSEPAWAFVLSAALYYTDDFERAFIYIVNFTLLIYLLLLVNVTNNAKSKLFFISFFILLNPLFIDFIHSQTRSALALSIVVISFYFNRALPRWIIASIATLTHTVSILLYSLEVLTSKLWGINLFSKNFLLTIVLLAFTSSLIVVFVLPYILQIVGDRRTNYIAESSSLLFSGFWAFYACYIFYICKKKNTLYLKKQGFFLGLAIFLSFLFFFLSIFGAYGSRFVAMGIPLYLITFSHLNTKNLILAIVPLYGFQILQYFYWI